ncbi:MAG TPA: copper homeostasis protein CutC, partial [Isosphaeraceae bacterium]|nr:copper homeostasis protein CutC [Isosphaeraceae bacterium]
EFDSMLLDIATARNLGASGVVLGVLNPDSTIDRDRTARLLDAARPLSVTFHRAFDEVPDPLAALETLQSLGIDRLLTSGCARSAREGLNTLKSLVLASQSSPLILPAGRICAEDLPSLASLGLVECHVGSSVQNDGLTDADLVRQFVKTAHDLP